MSQESWHKLQRVPDVFHHHFFGSFPSQWKPCFVDYQTSALFDKKRAQEATWQ